MSATASGAASAEFDQDVFTLAEVYADALIAAAEEKGQVEEVASGLDDLVAYMDRDAEFAGFLGSEAVDDDPRRISLEKLFRGKMNDLLLNGLQVLNNRGRLGLLRAVARVVELRMERRHHQQEVTVETASPLNDPLRAQIAQAVSARIGQEAILIEQVRPELIGGFILRIGDKQVDASVATRLKMMRKRLADRASLEVHRGRGVVEG